MIASGWWWVSTPRMTFGVQCDERGIITHSAPIGRRFVGQHMRNLGQWLRSQGSLSARYIGG